MSNFKKECSEELKIISNKLKSALDVIQQNSIAIEILERMKLIMIELCKYHSLDLSNDTIFKLCQVATLDYITIIVERNPQMKQTLGGFYKYGYYSKDEITDKKSESITDLLKPLRTAEKKYHDIIASQNQQARKANQNYSRLPYMKSKQEGRKYDFITLNLLNSYGQPASVWPFVDLLYFQKYFFQKERNTKSNKDLEYAYECYDNLIENILSIKESRDFVISFLQFRKFEVTYRFMLFAKIAQYQIDILKSKSLIIPRFLQVYYKRWKNPNPTIVASISNSTFLHEYDDYIVASYKYPKNNEKSDLILTLREMIREATAIYYHIYPAKDVNRFSETDYINIEVYLKNIYRVDSILIPLHLNNLENKHEYLNLIRNIYVKSDNTDYKAVIASRTIKEKQMRRNNPSKYTKK